MKKKKPKKDMSVSAINTTTDSLETIHNKMLKQKTTATDLFVKFEECRKDGTFKKDKKLHDSMKQQLQIEFSKLKNLQHKEELYKEKYGEMADRQKIKQNAEHNSKKEKGKKTNKDKKNDQKKSEKIIEDSTNSIAKKEVAKTARREYDFDKAILKYILNTGKYDLYDYLSNTEKRALLMKLWNLNRPILKGSLNAYQIYEIRHPNTNKRLTNPVDNRSINFEITNRGNLKSKDVYFVFGVRTINTKNLIYALYVSDKIEECNNFFLKHPVDMPTETVQQFRKRKLQLCEALVRIDNYLALEELHNATTSIMEYEVQYLSNEQKTSMWDEEKKCIIQSSNVIEKEKILQPLSVVNRSLIKLMCCLNYDICFYIFSLLGKNVQYRFLQYYWDCAQLIIPCTVDKNGDLVAEDYARGVAHYRNPFKKPEYPKYLNIRTDKNGGLLQWKKVLYKIDISYDFMNELSLIEGDTLWAIVHLKNEITNDSFLTAQYISGSKKECKEKYKSYGANYKGKTSVEQKISLIYLLANVYKVENRPYIKREIQALLMKMQERLAYDGQQIDVKSLLKKTEREKRDVTREAFLVRCNIWYCVHGHHRLQDVLAGVDIILEDGTTVKKYIPAAYCATCDLYYILDEDYKKLKGEGVILCKVVKKEVLLRENDTSETYLDLNEESVLHSLGYNVNAQEDLTVFQRRKILEYAVDNNILTRTAICNHLDWLINRSNGNRNLNLANQKWRDDRTYISQYQRGEKKTIDVESLEINEYRKGIR